MEASQGIEKEFLELQSPHLIRSLSGRWPVFIRYFAICVSLYHLVYISRLSEIFGHIPAPVFRSISLALLYTLTFLCIPHSRKRKITHIPWFEIIFIFFGVVPALYYGLAYKTIITQLGMATLLQQVLGAMLVIATLEAVRRVTSWILSALALFFVIYTLTCSYFPGLLHGASYSFARAMGNIYLFPEGMLGAMLDITVTTIVGFIIFGSFLQVAGASEVFIDLAKSATGRLKAGPALSVVVADIFFGMVSGSGVANTVGTGVITIPVMKKAGLTPEFAAATEAVSSTGGQLIPPAMGAAAFVMAEFLEMPYYLLCIAAILPSALYYLSLTIGIVFEVNRLPHIKKLPKEEIPSLVGVLAKGWFQFVPIGVLIYALIGLHLEPDISVFYSLLSLVSIMVIRAIQKRKFKKLAVTLADGLEYGTTGMIGLIGAVVAAGIIMGALSLTGLAISLSSDLVKLSGGNLLLLGSLCGIASTILGMGLPTLPVYIITALLFAPALVGFGIPPLAAHMFIFYFGLASMITPPVCLCAYVGASIAGADMFKTGYTAMRLGFGIYLIPFIFLVDPSIFLLVGGSLEKTLIATALSLFGILLINCGTSGTFSIYMRFNMVERLLLMIAGLFITIYLQRSINLFFAGLALAIFVIGKGFLKFKSRKAESFPPEKTS